MAEPEPHIVRYAAVFPAIVTCLRWLTGQPWDRYADYKLWWDEHGENFEIQARE